METPMFFQGSNRDPLQGDKAVDRKQFAFGPFRLDVDRHSLTRADEPLQLPPKCFDLLCLLLESNGALLEKNRLMQALWPDTFVEEANLSNLIAILRRVLGDSPAKSEYIQTVPKLGYRFKAKSNEEQPSSRALVSVNIQEQAAIRIIVFPFRVQRESDDAERLAFSLPESISNSLAELNAFTVRSIQVAMRFDPLRWEPKLVAEQTSVDFILTGTLDPGEFGFHAMVQLIQAASGTLVWSKSWKFETCEVLSFHQAVVQFTIRSLVQGNDREGLYAGEAGVSTRPEAFNTYLLANQLSVNRTPENMRLARDSYIACVEKDPNFAPAWARLGRCYRFLEKLGTTEERNVRLASSAFERAFAISPDLILAHSLYTPIEADSGRAETAMVRLLNRLNSHQNSPELFTALVHACRYCGQLDASLEAHRRALRLDPNVRTSVAHTFFALGDYERALFWYGTGAGLYLDALALTCMGREKEALTLLWTRRDVFNLMSAPMHSLNAYLRCDSSSGLAVLQAARSGAEYEPELQFYMARQASKFGEVDLGNDLLLRSVKAGYWSTLCMQRDRWLDPLRTTPEFHRTLEFAEDCESRSRNAFLNAGGERILSTTPV